MKFSFKNRGLGFYFGLAGGAVSLVTAVFYLIYAQTVNLYVNGIFILSLLGGLSSLLLFIDFPAMPLIPVLFSATALGYHLFDRVEMFGYMATGVYGMGEVGAIFEIVIALLALMAVAVILGIISCFLPHKKQA